MDLLVTSTSEADFALVVSSVHDLDEEHDGSILGEWIVDNSSLRRKVGYLAPSVDGQAAAIIALRAGRIQQYKRTWPGRNDASTLSRRDDPAGYD